MTDSKLDRPDEERKRGAAGRAERGGSEGAFAHEQRPGEFNPGPGGEPPQPGAEAETPGGDVEIPHDQWSSFLDSFSRQHEDWLVTIEVATASGRLVAVEGRRLKAVSIDRADGHERASIQVGDSPERRATQTVSNPTRIRFKRTHAGAHEGLEIASSDGSITIIRFRSAMHPEMLDGLAA